MGIQSVCPLSECCGSGVESQQGQHEMLLSGKNKNHIMIGGQCWTMLAAKQLQYDDQYSNVCLKTIPNIQQIAIVPIILQ